MTRKPLAISHPKLINLVCELRELSSHRHQLKADDVFCCLGTTIKKAKSKEAFRAVDLDAPVLLAKISRELGAQKFLLVSSLGANRNSNIFYNKVKGEVEDAIQKIAFNSLHILRPSLLSGHRQEERSGEDAAKFLYKVFGFLVPKKYQAIESIKVARAMIAFAQLESRGNFINESIELQTF
jgi:uncharacterized protein YbjT (DUF2867 family)